MNPSTVSLIVTAAYVLLALAFVTLGCVLVYRLVRAIGHVTFGSGTLFGTDGRARLITFGLAALVFPKVIVWSIYLTFFAVVSLFNELPQWWLSNWQRTASTCVPVGNSVALSECLGQTVFGFLQAVGGGLSDSYTNHDVNEAPFRDAVFLITLWAVLAQLLSVTEGAPTETEGRRRSDDFASLPLTPR